MKHSHMDALKLIKSALKMKGLLVWFLNL